MTTLILDITDNRGLSDFPEEINSSLLYALRVKVKRTEDLDYLSYQLEQAIKGIDLEKIVLLKNKYSQYDGEIYDLLKVQIKDKQVNISIITI